MLNTKAKSKVFLMLLHRSNQIVLKSIGKQSFFGCSNIESITVEAGNPTYHSEGNCLIETETKELILGCKNSVIPEDGSVTGIGRGAFAGNKSLTSITVPDSVTSIDEFAFRGCTGLTTLYLPTSLSRIHPNALSECESLTTIRYAGTVAQFETIQAYGCGIKDGVTAVCSNGIIENCSFAV